MSEPTSPQYAVGSIVNGHVWTGAEWVPTQVVTQAQPVQKSPWRTVAGVVALVCAALAGIQGLAWLVSFNDLQSQGNSFAGLLALLGLGALAVAAGFGITGIVLLTKK